MVFFNLFSFPFFVWDTQGPQKPHMAYCGWGSVSTETTYGLLWMGVNIHRNHIWLIVDGGQCPQKPHMAYCGWGSMSTETTYGLLWMGVNVHRNHIWLIGEVGVVGNP